MIFHCFRIGAIGDIIATSAATKQLAKYGKVYYYTHYPNVASMLEGVEKTFLYSTQYVNSGYESIVIRFDLYRGNNPGVYIGDAAIEDALLYIPGYLKKWQDLTLNKAELPALKSTEKILSQPYITIQHKSGWSTLKEYSFFEIIREQLEKYIRVIMIDENDYNNIFSYIQHAQLHIGIDSSGNHIAAAYNTPSIILWGATSPRWYGYHSAINIVNKVDCHPCEFQDKYSNGYFGKCKKEIKCIDQTNPHYIISLAKTLLKI